MSKSNSPKLRIHIRKEALKFSAAHMTLFPDGSKEALHGHNYQVSAELAFKESFELPFIAFADIKNELRKACQAWDEKILLAKGAPHFKIIKADSTQIEFELCKKFYSLPADETVLLPVTNITSEALALTMGQNILKALGDILEKASVKKFVLKIEESPGQGASISFQV